MAVFKTDIILCPKYVQISSILNALLNPSHPVHHHLVCPVTHEMYCSQLDF